MIRPVLEWPDPRLLLPCQPWTLGQFPDLEQNLLDTLADQQALGLAANQIAVDCQAMAMHVQATDQRLVLFNPVLVSASEEKWSAAEGCLSFPGLRLEIARPRSVSVRYQDGQGRVREAEFETLDAKCFLHELDHLQGRVFKDLVSPLKFLLANKKSRRR